MDNKTIAMELSPGIEKRVSEHRGWCRITPLSGELEEGLFMATFADDTRTVFEETYEKNIHLLLTEGQTFVWDKELTREEQVETLEEIAVFFDWYNKERRKEKRS